MSEGPIIEAIANAGVGAIISVVMLVGLYRIAGSLGGRLIEVGEAQARAMGAQAQAMEGLTQSVREIVLRDSNEHREMLLLLRYLSQRQEVFEEVRRERKECKAQANAGGAA